MADLIQMQKQGSLYVPSDISDYCDDVAVRNTSVSELQNQLTPYQRERRDFLKAAGGFIATLGLGLTIDALIPDNAGAGDAFASAGYKKVTPEELGLRFEYSPCRRQAKWRDKKAKHPDTYFFDVTIHNNSNIDYQIEQLILATPHRSAKVSSEIIKRVSGTNIISKKENFFQADRSTWVNQDANWPILLSDTYFLKDSYGNKFKFTVQKSIP